MKSKVVLAFLFAALVTFTALFLLADLEFVVSLETPVWLGAVLVTAAFAAGIHRASPSRAFRVTAAALVSIVFLSRFVSLTPAKPFRTFYHSLRPGMSVPEVEKRLAACFPVNGRFRAPVEHLSEPRLSFQLDPNNGNYDSEFVTIKLRAHRILSVEYSFD